MGKAQIDSTGDLFSTPFNGGGWNFRWTYPTMRGVHRHKFHSFWISFDQVRGCQSFTLLTLRVYGSYPRMTSYNNFNPIFVIRRVDLGGVAAISSKSETTNFSPIFERRWNFFFGKFFFQKRPYWGKTGQNTTLLGQNFIHFALND